jgi:hypothetical protein
MMSRIEDMVCAGAEGEVSERVRRDDDDDDDEEEEAFPPRENSR